jgi:hypothetical protein
MAVAGSSTKLISQNNIIGNKNGGGCPFVESGKIISQPTALAMHNLRANLPPPLTGLINLKQTKTKVRTARTAIILAINSATGSLHHFRRSPGTLRFGASLTQLIKEATHRYIRYPAVSSKACYAARQEDSALKPLIFSCAAAFTAQRANSSPDPPRKSPQKCDRS